MIKINRNVTRKRRGNINNKISTRHETREESTRFKFNVIVAWWSRNGFTRISGHDAPPTSKQKFSPETLLPFISVIKCALRRCLHRDPLVHVTFNRIDRYRSLHAHVVPWNDIHRRTIACLLIDRMLLNVIVNVIEVECYYVSINSWNDLILETKTKTKVESKVALRFVYWLFRFRFALDEGEREFTENETKRN